MRRLLAIARKEFLLVSRDIHAVGVLFVMPVAFLLNCHFPATHVA